MNATHAELGRETEDRTSGDPAWAVLDLTCRLLTDSESSAFNLDTVLRNLAAASVAEHAGFAGLIDKFVPLRFHANRREGAEAVRWPWDEWPNLLEHLPALAKGELRQARDGRQYLLAATPRYGAAWLLWLEAARDHSFTSAEHAALALACGALGRLLESHPLGRRWETWLARSRRQQRLEDASRMAARVAHDFNNVLASVMGFTELSLGQLPANAPARGFIKEVHEASLQGTRLVKQLGTVARRGKLSAQPFRLTNVLPVLMARLQKATGKSIDLQIESLDGLPLLALDGDSAQLIIEQLVDNAIEAIASAGTVSVSGRLVDLGPSDCLDLMGSCAPGRYVEIRVTDTGSGFTPEARERVLSDLIYTSKPKHRGLGLASVYGLLCAYQGGLAIEHRAEGGTTVRCVVPVSALATNMPPNRLSSAGALRAPSSEERVLVVDDDPWTLSFMCTTLEQAGYLVQSAMDGASALDSFDRAKEPFCLVLSDVLMPRMTGFELAKRLLDRNPGLAILFTSGHVPSGCVPEPFAGQPYDFLPKPFPPDGLLRAVRTALTRDTNPTRSKPLVEATEKRPRE
jgi:signal transduction histidine kinase/CheY-like chemotaxis protein